MCYSHQCKISISLRLINSSEEKIKTSPSKLFLNEKFQSPEKIIPIMPFPKPLKSPVRRLNFERENMIIQNSTIPVEITRVSDFQNFISPSINKNINTKESGFQQLKSSPMQMFNSFSSNSEYFSQTIEQKAKGGLIFSEGKILNKKMCCNCKKSHCLKLYCECFATKSYCQGCNCVSCLNIP